MLLYIFRLVVCIAIKNGFLEGGGGVLWIRFLLMLTISDFDDDPLSELEKLDPLPSSQAQSSSNGAGMDPLSQQPSSVHMPVCEFGDFLARFGKEELSKPTKRAPCYGFEMTYDSGMHLSCIPSFHLCF